MLEFIFAKGRRDTVRNTGSDLLGVTLGVVVARIAHHLTGEWEQLITPRE